MAKCKPDAKVALTALQKKLLAAVTLPLPAECPTRLRYALAKFDAGAVAEAYEMLRQMERDNLLEN